MVTVDRATGLRSSCNITVNDTNNDSHMEDADTVDRHSSSGANSAGTDNIIDHDNVVEAKQASDHGNLVMVIQGTDAQGVYLATWSGGSRLFAVNLLDAEESNTQPRDEIKLGEQKIEAGRQLVYRAAWLKDQGRDFALAAAQAKLYTGELSHRVANAALQIHGGYGFMEESAISRFYRDQKILEIGEGTNEVQRMVIAKHLGL